MSGAIISYSGMERRWFVWPGQGRPMLSFDDERAARDAKAAIDAGQPVPASKRPAAVADRTIFMPSRSTKAQDSEGLVVEEPPVQAGRPMPKWPGRAAQIAASQPKRNKHARVILDVEKARGVYQATGSLAKTAARFGIGFMTLRRHFVKAGVPINPPVRPRTR